MNLRTVARRAIRPEAQLRLRMLRLFASAVCRFAQYGTPRQLRDGDDVQSAK